VKLPLGGKLFYKIGEVSRITGLESYVLRYWETEFPPLNPKKGRGGQRVYMSKDIETVLKIKRMLYEEGFTIAGARKQLMSRGGEKPSEKVSPASEMMLHRLRANLKELLSTMRSSDSAPRS
jgi:DNA-binding transcriptional MerR regulator